MTWAISCLKSYWIFCWLAIWIHNIQQLSTTSAVVDPINMGQQQREYQVPIPDGGVRFVIGLSLVIHL